MKKLITGLLLLSMHLSIFAQVKGNKKIVTKTFPIENLNNLEMNLYAKVYVDCAAKEEMTITGDENLIELIETSMEGNRLVLTQKEWIQPSQDIKINIGAPNLERIQNSVHETTYVKNIKRQNFQAMAIIGKLVLEGEVEDLSASGEIGEVDARKVQAKSVNVNLWKHGKIQLGNPQNITGIVKEDGQVIYEGTTAKVNVKTKEGGEIRSKDQPVAKNKFDTKFIDLKVKNNSLNRINCYVKGPKPDGKYFSYGFPMNPGQVRKKHWTIGSKIYRVTNIGTRKLLAEVVATDEGETLKLYQN